MDYPVMDEERKATRDQPAAHMPRIADRLMSKNREERRSESHRRSFPTVDL
jgi:hypothetical protein